MSGVFVADVVLLGIDRKCSIRPRQVRVRVEDQAVGRQSRVFNASTLWIAECQERCVDFCGPGSCSSFIEQDFEKRAPITVKFEIPYFTVSGIQVRYLKIVEKSGYQALPWVRYITQNGDDYRCAFLTSFCYCCSFILAFERLWKRGARRLCPCELCRLNRSHTYKHVIICFLSFMPLPLRPITRRLFSTKSLPFNPRAVERAEDQVDVCIVGAGPAGLSAAIRLKQLEREKGNEIRVVVLEKGSEIGMWCFGVIHVSANNVLGSHIVSGAVIEPRALNELLPNWKSMPDHPLTQEATSSRMMFMTKNMTLPMPHPPQMSNEGNYIVSLSQFTRWLASVAEEEYGVEIYPGFAGAQLLMSDEADSVDPWDPQSKVRSVRGVVTNDIGLTKNYRLKSSFEPGMAFQAKVTLLAEGAHGSLSKQAIARYKLRKESQPQTYGIGLKEVWRVDPSKYRPGEVIHTLGWPIDTQTYGGGWVYHMADGLVSMGLVIGLDYKNPYLSPYRELQASFFIPVFFRRR